MRTWFNSRGRSRAAATSKMERFVIILLTIITKRYILDVAAALDSPLNKMQRDRSTTLYQVITLNLT